jgi:hypothetical protein
LRSEASALPRRLVLEFQRISETIMGAMVESGSQWRKTALRLITGVADVHCRQSDQNLEEEDLS